MGLRSLMWELASFKVVAREGRRWREAKGDSFDNGAAAAAAAAETEQAWPGTNERTKNGENGKKEAEEEGKYAFLCCPSLEGGKANWENFLPSSVTLRISRHGKTNFLKIFLPFSLTRLQSLRAPRRPNPFAARPVPSSPRRGGSAVRPTQPVFT